MHIHAWLRDVCLCESVCSREALIKSVLEGGGKNITCTYKLYIKLCGAVNTVITQAAATSREACCYCLFSHLDIFISSKKINMSRS